MTGGRVAARPGSGRRTRARGRAGGSGTPLDAAAPPGFLGPGSPRSQAEQRRCPRPEPSRSQTDAPGQRGGRVEPPLVSCRSRSSLRVLQGVAGARLPTHCDTLSHGGTVPGPRAPRAFCLPKRRAGSGSLLLSLPLILGGIARAARYLFRLERLPRAARGGSGAASPTTPRGRGPDPGPTPPAPGGAGRCSRGSPEGPRRAAGGTRLRLPVPPRDGPGVNVSFLTG